MLFAETEAISYFKLHWLHIAIYFNPQQVLVVAQRQIPIPVSLSLTRRLGKILSFPTTFVGSALAFYRRSFWRVETMLFNISFDSFRYLIFDWQTFSHATA